MRFELGREVETPVPPVAQSLGSGASPPGSDAHPLISDLVQSRRNFIDVRALGQKFPHDRDVTLVLVERYFGADRIPDCPQQEAEFRRVLAEAFFLRSCLRVHAPRLLPRRVTFPHTRPRQRSALPRWFT